MRQPTRTRNNPKARTVAPPPPGIDLANVAASCRYSSNPYHKRGHGAGTRHRPDASICPRELTNARTRVQGWLRNAVRAGHVGAWERGRNFPGYVWYRDGEMVYEARQGSPGSGEYHGYPLSPEQRVRGLP